MKRKKSIIYAILFFSLPILITAEEKSDTLSFIHIADTHICNLAGYNPVFVERRQHYGEGVEPLKEFFRSVPKKLRSDFVVITGDMIDYYEAETASGDMLATEVEQFASLINISDVPVYLTLGNHDIASYWVNSESSYTSHQYNAGKARASWIRNVSCFRNGTYYSRKFQVDTTTYRLIFLDNAYYSPDRAEEGKTDYIIDKYQLLWLDDQLNKSGHDVEIIFMHMPLFNPTSEDLASTRNTYLLDLDDTVAINHELDISYEDSQSIYSVLAKNSSARLIISGHRHSSVIHDVQLSDDYSLFHVMTGSFARDSSNWRLIQLTGESIIISHPGETKTQYKIQSLTQLENTRP